MRQRMVSRIILPHLRQANLKMEATDANLLICYLLCLILLSFAVPVAFSGTRTEPTGPSPTPAMQSSASAVAVKGIGT